MCLVLFNNVRRDGEGHPKGDGSVCYVKAESVDMAINVLHEGQLRPGVTIEVCWCMYCVALFCLALFRLVLSCVISSRLVLCYVFSCSIES